MHELLKETGSIDENEEKKQNNIAQGIIKSTSNYIKEYYEFEKYCEVSDNKTNIFFKSSIQEKEFTIENNYYYISLKKKAEYNKYGNDILPDTLYMLLNIYEFQNNNNKNKCRGYLICFISSDKMKVTKYGTVDFFISSPLSGKILEYTKQFEQYDKKILNELEEGNTDLKSSKEMRLYNKNTYIFVGDIYSKNIYPFNVIQKEGDNIVDTDCDIYMKELRKNDNKRKLNNPQNENDPQNNPQNKKKKGGKYIDSYIKYKVKYMKLKKKLMDTKNLVIQRHESI